MHKQVLLHTMVFYISRSIKGVIFSLFERKLTLKGSEKVRKGNGKYLQRLRPSSFVPLSIFHDFMTLKCERPRCRLLNWLWFMDGTNDYPKSGFLGIYIEKWFYAKVQTRIFFIFCHDLSKWTAQKLLH